MNLIGEKLIFCPCRQFFSIRGTDIIWIFFTSRSPNDLKKQLKNKKINWEVGACNKGLKRKIHRKELELMYMLRDIYGNEWVLIWFPREALKGYIDTGFLRYLFILLFNIKYHWELLLWFIILSEYLNPVKKTHFCLTALSWRSVL